MIIQKKQNRIWKEVKNMNHDLIESIDNAEFNNEFEFEDSIKNKLLMFLKLKLKRDYFVEPENIKKI